MANQLSVATEPSTACAGCVGSPTKASQAPDSAFRTPQSIQWGVPASADDFRVKRFCDVEFWAERLDEPIHDG